MNNVYINGIGLLSRVGSSYDEIFRNLNFQGDILPSALKYESLFEKSELRRMTRYARIAADFSAYCLADAGIEDIKNRNNENMGIIFTTGYGASESNIKFFNSVAKKDPDFCSPLTFASTVPNYSLGNICILLGIKGYSTTLLGGNPLDLALPILKSGRIKEIIIGSEEEYCKEVFEAVDKVRKYNDPQLSEGCTAMYLSCSQTKRTYASVVYSSSVALESSPILSDVSFISEDKLDIIKTEKPDIIFGVGTQLEFGKQEKSVFNKIFPDVPYISDVRKIFGETLGNSFLLNVAFAAVCLKNKRNPINKDINKILATGIDIQGNYMYVLLKSAERI